MKVLFKTPETKTIELLKNTWKYDDLIRRDEYSILTNTVTHFRDPTSIQTIISLILNDETLLNEVLKNSYRHQNGFHKIVLSKGDLFKLRLHIFESIPEIDFPMENIHNHRWNFASQIIRGKLKMEIFKRDKFANELFFDYEYKPANQANKYQVNLLGLSSLLMTEERVFQAGESYYMDREEMHRIINFPEEKAVTIVMTGVSSNNQCKLFSANIFAEKQKEVLKYTKNELIDILKTI